MYFLSQPVFVTSFNLLFKHVLLPHRTLLLLLYHTFGVTHIIYSTDLYRQKTWYFSESDFSLTVVVYSSIIFLWNKPKLLFFRAKLNSIVHMYLVCFSNFSVYKCLSWSHIVPMNSTAINTSLQAYIACLLRFLWIYI